MVSLAGLVGITAPCAFVSVPWAAVIGLIAGVIVVFSVTIVDGLKIDDPVGAISVHGVCGVVGEHLPWAYFLRDRRGTIYGEGGGPAAGLFLGGGLEQVIPQIVGIISVAVFTLVGAGLAWTLVKTLTGGIRVSEEEEIKGLDIGEHGMEAYSGFVTEDVR